jgi:heat shock protein HslJ
MSFWYTVSGYRTRSTLVTKNAMKTPAVRTTIQCLLIMVFASQALGQDPLPSWNEAAAKKSIVAFVEKVIQVGTSDFVPEPERIAVFDNDGCLWCENPIPFQAAFALDEIKRRMTLEPALNSDPMVQAALAGDIGKLLEGKHHDGLMRILALTHTGMTTDAFNVQVKNWIATSKHPRFGKPYTELTYQPMLELLRYLRSNGFKTFIVSGGGADFMRVWSEDVYGIPPENVVGSTGMVKFELRDGKPTLVKTLDHLFVDDKEGKPIGIHQFIGRRPIACFGNSDGDQAMLEYTTIGNPRPSFGLIVHHTDADREYAYDANPKSSGKLISALEVAPKNGWTVVDMKADWKQVWSTSKSDPAVGTTPSLIGKWLVEDIAGRGVVDRAQSTLEVTDDGSVSGNTCVNNFGGKATIHGQTIVFGPLVMTRRAGPPALMDQESRYTNALERVVGFRLDENGLLFLVDADQKSILRFSKMKN